MAIPNLESREELSKWLAAREAQLNKWEAELRTKQQTLDAQEAYLAAKGKLCAKCQGAVDHEGPNAKVPPALPRTQAPQLQIRTAPIGVPFNSPSLPVSTANTRAQSPSPASASQRVPVRPTLVPTPVLPGRGGPPIASASMRLPPRLPQPPTAATTATVPEKKVNSSWSPDVPSESKQNVEGGVGAFPGCLLEGFMIKKGAKVKNWKRRYFVLQESGKLMYFENSDGKKLLGQLQVDSESSVGIRGNGGEGEDGGFWVCPEPNGRIYELETGDIEIRDKWVAALNKLVGPMNKPRQWKQAKPKKSGDDSSDSKPKVNVVVQVAGSFFNDGEQQSLEARIYPDEVVSDAIQRSVKLLSLLPRVHKDKLSRPLSLANSQGDILKPSQIVHPLDVVFLQEA